MLMALASSMYAADMTIWHRQPASQWNEATPIGNGRLGAMIFGNTDTERIQLNEDSLWSGAPQDADNPDALKALTEKSANCCSQAQRAKPAIEAAKLRKTLPTLREDCRFFKIPVSPASRAGA